MCILSFINDVILTSRKIRDLLVDGYIESIEAVDLQIIMAQTLS